MAAVAARRTAIGTPTPIPTFAPVERPSELEDADVVATAVGRAEETGDVTVDVVVAVLDVVVAALDVVGNVDVVKPGVVLMLDVPELGVRFGIVWPSPAAQQSLSKHQVPSSHNTRATSLEPRLR